MQQPSPVKAKPYEEPGLHQIVPRKFFHVAAPKMMVPSASAKRRQTLAYSRFKVQDAPKRALHDIDDDLKMNTLRYLQHEVASTFGNLQLLARRQVLTQMKIDWHLNQR